MFLTTLRVFFYPSKLFLFLLVKSAFRTGANWLPVIDFGIVWSS